MTHVTWTGHPFVDAGLAALAVLAEVESLEDLKPKHFEIASRKLQRVLLSDQALGIGVEQAFVSGPLSQLFPNSEIVNPSSFLVRVQGGLRDIRRLLSGTSRIPREWQEVIDRAKEKLRNALERDLSLAQKCLVAEGEIPCTICGRYVPREAIVSVRKDKVPLLEGIVNFYPAFSWGVQACGICVFALRFLPFSVMRIGNRLFILHTQSLPLAAKTTERYGWQHYNRAIAQNRALDFFGDWETAGEAGTVLYFLCELLEDFAGEIHEVYTNSLPTVAYIFSNDNRGGYIHAVPVPNAILEFLARLRYASRKDFLCFWYELFRVPRTLQDSERRKRAGFVQEVARRILAEESIIGLCLIDETQELAGGWIGHRLYLEGVRKVRMDKLALLEGLGIAIAQREDSKKLVNELRTTHWRDLYGVFLSYVKKGLLQSEEFYALFPPNEDASLSEVRDIVLAVVYEWQRSQERGEAFAPLKKTWVFAPDETIKYIQDIGARLLRELSNPSRWIGQLQTAKTADRVRGVYLSALRQGILGFSDFVFLVPPDNSNRLWLLRDYLLAFLYEHARDSLLEDDTVTHNANTEEV